MFFNFFINRPIFASVLSIVIVLGGGIAFIASLPEIPPPAIEVSAHYPGATAEVLAKTVGAPIEEQMNGVLGKISMSSQCSDDGHYTLTVKFEPDSDLSIFQWLVSNRVNFALESLPEPVQQHGVSVKKKPPDIVMPLFPTVQSRRVGIALLVLLGLLSLGALGLLSLVLRLVRKGRRPEFAVEGLAGPSSGKAIAAAFHPDDANGHSSTPDGLRAVPTRRADGDGLNE